MLGFTRIWTAGMDPLPFQNLAGWNRRFADAFQISPSLEELPGEVICFWDGSGGGQDPWEMPDRVRAVLFLNTDGQYGMYRPGQGEKEKFLSMRPLSIQKRRLEAGTLPVGGILGQRGLSYHLFLQQGGAPYEPEQ